MMPSFLPTYTSKLRSSTASEIVLICVAVSGDGVSPPAALSTAEADRRKKLLRSRRLRTSRLPDTCCVATPATSASPSLLAPEIQLRGFKPSLRASFRVRGSPEAGGWRAGPRPRAARSTRPGTEEGAVTVSSPWTPSGRCPRCRSSPRCRRREAHRRQECRGWASSRRTGRPNDELPLSSSSASISRSALRIPVEKPRSRMLCASCLARGAGDQHHRSEEHEKQRAAHAAQSSWNSATTRRQSVGKPNGVLEASNAVAVAAVGRSGHQPRRPR